VLIGLQQTLDVVMLVRQMVTVLLVNFALRVCLLAVAEILLILLLLQTADVDTVLLTINFKELWDDKAKIFPNSLLH
jgi:hypothetical protein